jgi:succinylarginine dihydrolase
LEQSTAAIDAGVFHNDVIAMSNENLFIYHESAYTVINETLPSKFQCLVIKESELPLCDAVQTYFFNSQLITLPNGAMAVVAPKECEAHIKARQCFDRLVSEGYVSVVHYLDVRESMKNGGGPACLRLRIALTEKERKAVPEHLWLDDTLYHSLCRWIDTNYRDKISIDDLRDPTLAEEARPAVEQLFGLLKMDMGAA